MKRSLLDRVSDISKIHDRAAFVDVEHQIKKHAGSDAFLRLADKRYSCRAFSHRSVSAAKIRKILEAGRLAPSAKNLQPVHVWVISTEEALSRIRIVHSCYDAPVVLMVGYKASEAWVRPVDGKNSAEVDAAIVGTHMMLAATDQELDSVWIGSFDPALLRDILPGVEGYELVAMINVGYPAAGCEPSAMHGVRKPVEELVTRVE